MTDSASAKPTGGPSFPAWDEKDPMGSLAALFRFAFEKGQSQIDWYRDSVKGVRLAGLPLCAFLATLREAFAFKRPKPRGVHEKQNSNGANVT